MKYWILFLIGILFIMPILSAQIIIVKPGSDTITDASILNVNSSNFADVWISDTLGYLDDASDTQFNNNANTLEIDTSWLTNFGNSIWCALTGCTMQGDINMNNNDIDNIKNLNVTGNATFKNITINNKLGGVNSNSSLQFEGNNITIYF